MRINLKLRAVSAYFSPAKITLADNEDLEIKLLDKGQLRQRVVLLCNGTSYVGTDKMFTIPRGELSNVNTLELTEREEETDKILKRITVENLYVMPCAIGGAENRLLAEREFYQQTFKELLAQISTLLDRQHKLENKVAELENGKFTMLKFGGNTK